MVLGPHVPNAALSARQLEVAKLIAAGISTRDVADKLALSPRTVEAHVAAIFDKLGVRTRVQLTALLAVEPGETNVGNIDPTPAPLIGRESDIATIAALSSKNRIVTILGTGGLGKTQTAIRVAAQAAHGYPDGAWFIDLAAGAGDDFVAMEIAQTMNLALTPGEKPELALARRLKAKKALLVLDNCEHLVHRIAPVVATLVGACPHVWFIATSREPLAISGEVTYRLPALASAMATALFIARARARDADFHVDNDRERAIAQICGRLDGLPLAIELAAARCATLAPRELLARLDSRFALLDSGLRDALPRHQSLRALVDWSYEQLRENEQALFRRLGVFASSFSLPAAHAVSGLPRSGEVDLITSLSSLIDKSLVTLDRENDLSSYRLLESMRVYARMKLEEREEAGAVARLQIRYLRDTLHEINALPESSSKSAATAFFRKHIADIRASLDAAIATGDVATGAELLDAIGVIWSSSSIAEGIARVESYLAALGETEPANRARLLAHLSELRWRAGEQDLAIEAAAQAVRVARTSTDTEALGWALIAEAGACVLKDPARARALLVEFEALAGLGASARQAGHQLRARLAYMENDFERATASYQMLIDEDRRAGNVSSEGHSTWMLANIEYKIGRPERAVELGRVARDLIERTNDVWLISMVNRSLAGFLVASDAYAEAERTAWDALALYADIDPNSTHVGTLVEILGFVAATRGAYERAATLIGFASAAAARPGAVVYRSSTLAVRERLERCLADAIVAGALSEAELATLRERGARLRAEDAIALAMG